LCVLIQDTTEGCIFGDIVEGSRDLFQGLIIRLNVQERIKAVSREEV